MNKKIVYDHRGTEYKSLVDMCSKYGITAHIFQNRISRGWSLKDALLTPIRIRKESNVHDHLGNSFDSISDMCRAYLIDRDTFRKRIKRGYTLEKALTDSEDKNK